MKKLLILTVLVTLVSMFSCIDKQEPAYIRVSKGSVNLPTPNDTSFTLKIYYSNDWQVAVRDPSWCRVSPSSGKGKAGKVLDSMNLNVVVDKNATDAVRENTLRLTSFNLVLETIIRQAK